MEVVICYCIKCKAELGRFRNAWNGIGNTYFSPIYECISGGGLETTGDVFEAAPGSSIQSSLLRDVVCARCKAVLGLRCDKAPPQNHILKQDQLVLRLKETTIISEGSGKVANVSVLKTIPLKDDKNNDSLELLRASIVHPSLRAPDSISVAGSSTQNLPDVGNGKPEHYEAQMLPKTKQLPQAELTVEIKFLISEVEKFKGWAEEVILNQQKNIDRLSETIFRIEKDMQILKTLMEEISPDSTTCDQDQDCDNNTEFAEVKDEIKLVSGRLNQKEDTLICKKTASLLTRNLKTVASEVTNLSDKAFEVNYLKLSLKALESRLHFLEGHDQVPCCSQVSKPKQSSSTEPISRKRTHDQVEKEIENQKEKTNTDQLMIKKRHSDKIRIHEIHETTHQNLRNDIIDLVSQDPTFVSLKKQDDQSNSRENHSEQKKRYSYRKPQVLIYGSNIKLSTKDSKENLGLLQSTVNEKTSEHQNLITKSSDKSEEKRRKSELALQKCIQNSYALPSSRDAKNSKTVDLNQYAKLDKRFLRNRKINLTKD